MKTTTAAFLSISFLLVIGAACAPPPETAVSSDTASTYSITLTVPTPGELPKCTSARSGTVAFVASPATLWSCTGSKWVPIPCVQGLGGAVAYSSATNTLVACVAGAWTPVALPQGPKGDPGPMGTPGEEGAVGAKGDPGAPASLATLAGTACTLAGEVGKVHVDTSADGAVTLRCVVGPDLKTDPLNCGALGHDVSRLPNASGTCVDGQAVLACDAGWTDLDGETANGCEVCGTREQIAGRIDALVAQVQKVLSSGSLCIVPGSTSGTVDATYCESSGCGGAPGCSVSVQGTAFSVDAGRVVSGTLNGGVAIPFDASYAFLDLSCTMRAIVKDVGLRAHVAVSGPDLTLGFDDVRLSGGSIEMNLDNCSGNASVFEPIVEFLAPFFEGQVRSYIVEAAARASLTFACQDDPEFGRY
jgi:hypothetical protein